LSVSRARFDVVEEVKTALFAMFFLVGAVSAQAGNLWLVISFGDL